MALQIACWVVLGLGALLIAMNWSCLILSWRTKKHVSMVPPLGAVLAFMASAVLPIGWRLGLLAFVLDPGALAVIAALARMIVRRDA